jgi:hypothetical protein
MCDGGHGWRCPQLLALPRLVQFFDHAKHFLCATVYRGTIPDILNHTATVTVPDWTD